MDKQSHAFDLEVLPASDRFPFWRTVGSRIYRPLPVGAQLQGQLSVHASTIHLGRITLVKMVATQQEYERTDTMLRSDDCNHFILTVLEKGTILKQTSMQDFSFTAGDVLLLDASETARSRWSAHAQLFASIPRDMLLKQGPGALRTAWLPRHHPHAAMLTNHLRMLWQIAAAGHGGAVDALGVGLASLTAAYFSDRGVVQCLNELADADDLVLLVSIKQWIEDHLHHIDLDANLLAERFHLSRSSLYRLFQSSGGVMSYIRERRLQLAMQRLRTPESACHQLSSLARSLGFPSNSAFSHAFRRRWGVAPKRIQTDPNRFLNDSVASMAESWASEADCQTWHELSRYIDNYYRKLSGPIDIT
jgi:AraC-like DNA-binding protein